MNRSLSHDGRLFIAVDLVAEAQRPTDSSTVVK